MAPTRACARERLIIVEFRGFRRARSPQGMLCECSDSAHRLHSKKPLPWRVTGASVARHVERPWVRSKNVYIAEPAPELQPMCCEIGAPVPRDRRGVGRLPSTRSGATSSGASSAVFNTGDRPTTVSPEADRGSRRASFPNADGCRIGDQKSRPMNESVATPIVANTKVARTGAAERMRRYRIKHTAHARA